MVKQICLVKQICYTNMSATCNIQVSRHLFLIGLFSINLQKKQVNLEVLHLQQYPPNNNHYSVSQRCLTRGVLSEQNAPVGCVFACSTNKAYPCNNNQPTCNRRNQQIQQYQRFQANRVNRAIRVKQLNQANVHKILTNILLYPH